MTTSFITGFDPKKYFGNLGYRNADNVEKEIEDYEVMLMTQGKMSKEMIEYQKIYHYMVHQLLYDPRCMIDSVDSVGEDDCDKVVVTFKKPKESEYKY